MKQEWEVEEITELRGYVIEWIAPGFVFFSKKNKIFKATETFGKREFVGEVDTPWWKRVAAMLRLGQRLLRFMVYNVLPLPNGSMFVTFGRQVGIISKNVYFPLQGIKRPCRILRGGCALAGNGAIYWGEYIPNIDRGSIDIYKYLPGDKSAEMVYSFPPGEIRHVHGIFTDPYTDALWCVTGDLSQECKIMRTYDGFRNCEIVGEGDETWRTLSLVFTQDAIYYASDAEFRANYIYRIDRSTEERIVLGEIDGPVYYAHAVGKDLFFAVTAELCPSQKGTSATLWHIGPSQKVNRVFSYPKDLFQNKLLLKLFMPGTLHFPSGPGKNGESYVNGVGLRGFDNRTLHLYCRNQV